jgi:LysM domain-containing protein
VSLGNYGSRLRCLVVWSAGSAAVGLTALATSDRASAVVTGMAHGDLARTPLDLALTDLAAALLLGCAVWWWLVITVVVVEAARGVADEGRRRRGVPGGVRRVVLAACGVALVGGLAQPSYAGSSHRGLAGLPLPDRAVAWRHGARADHPAAPPQTVVVRSGDTLWSIAARGLPPDSPAVDITARWHSIYAANRSLIGPDPDVIVPGQQLRLPGKERS